MKYESYCDEHDVKLVNGCCPKCRDEHGSTFPLDMQSTYLKEKGETPNGAQDSQDPER